MLRILIFVLFITSAIIFGDWKNIKKYYPTILYFIVCNLIYMALYQNYPLWRFEPLPPTDKILFNDILISIVLTFTVFPCTAIIFLSKYPSGWKQIPYMFFWIILYSAIEFLVYKRNGISYHNGWSYGWSILFNACIFPLFKVHSIKPLYAWGLSIAFLVFNFIMFGFPVK